MLITIFAANYIFYAVHFMRNIIPIKSSLSGRYSIVNPMKLITLSNHFVNENRILTPRQTDQTHLPDLS